MESKHQPWKRYDDEFKRNAVELLESSGRPIAEVAGDLAIPYKTLERWRAKYRRDRMLPAPKAPATQAGQPSSRERELEKRLAYVERERDILKKALAICSRDPELRNGSS
jgi:transposase-like protein